MIEKVLDYELPKQFSVQGHQLKMQVKPAPLFFRVFFFLAAVLVVLSPIINVIFEFLSGSTFRIFFLLSLALGGFIGFFLFRYALWNAFGQEIMTLSETELSYVTDYRWFKSSFRSWPINSDLQFALQPVGYIEDHKGVLTITQGDLAFVSAIKMPIVELEELIALLEKEWT